MAVEMAELEQSLMGRGGILVLEIYLFAYLIATLSLNLNLYKLSAFIEVDVH